jgi:hypothetical protein
MRAEVTNRFNTKSEMTKLTPDFIEMKLSPASTWHLISRGWFSTLKVSVYMFCSYSNITGKIPVMLFFSNFVT